MHAHDLVLDLCHLLPYDMKGGIVGAVKRNASLRTVVINDDFSDEWHNENDRMKLTLYCRRNAFLGQWMENPNVVPRAAWPEYLAAVQITGPDAVFGILQALAPSLWAVVDEQGRKRRRSELNS